MRESWILFVQRLHLVIGMIWNITSALVCVLALFIFLSRVDVATLWWGVFIINFAYVLINWTGHAILLGLSNVLAGHKLGEVEWTRSALFIGTLLGPMTFIMDIISARMGHPTEEVNEY